MHTEKPNNGSVNSKYQPFMLLLKYVYNFFITILTKTLLWKINYNI